MSEHQGFADAIQNLPELADLADPVQVCLDCLCSSDVICDEGCHCHALGRCGVCEVPAGLETSMSSGRQSPLKLGRSPLEQCLAETDNDHSPHLGTCICRQGRYHIRQHGCAVCGHRWTGWRPAQQ